MKTFITIAISSLCLFIGTVSADKPDWAIKNKHNKDTIEVHKDKFNRDNDDDKHGMKPKDMHKNKRMKKHGHDDDNGDGGKQDKRNEVMERMREKKSSSEQKELDNISDSAQENRKKWWNFWK